MRTVVGALFRSAAAAAASASASAPSCRATGCCTSTPALAAYVPVTFSSVSSSRAFGLTGSVAHFDTSSSCVGGPVRARSFAMAARPLRAASDADANDSENNSQQSDASAPPKRRLAAFDDLFFDATPPPAPKARTNHKSNGARAQQAYRSGNNTKWATNAAKEEEPTGPAAAKAFPQPGTPVAKAQSNRKAVKQSPPQSSDSDTYNDTSKEPQISISEREQPRASILASQWHNRAIPPPMEYDYDYYDDEMGVSGSMGMLNGDEKFDFEPSDPGLGAGEQSEAPEALSLPSIKNDVEADKQVESKSESGVETGKTPAPEASAADRYADIMGTTPISSPPPSAANTAPDPSAEVVQIMAGSSNGNGQMTQVDILTSKSESIQSSVYAENGGKEFNINSPKQVAKVLFGDASQSTNKDVLDAMASAGNRMADLILQYRQAQRDLKRAKKQTENKANGIHVDDFHKAPPPSPIAATKPSSNEDSAAETSLEFDDANGSNPLLLVDASAYIFRAYYSMPPLHRADGMPVGAVLGFCNMLNRLVLNRSLAGDQPRIVLVFDSKGKTFRHDMYPDYKANRGPCPEDLVPQFDLIREAATAYGIDQIEAPSFEADDVIATLATMARDEGINVHVLSGDKDLMQLVTPPNEEPSINMIDPKEMIRVTYDVVVDKFGVPPALLGDVLALAGDKSDNIPGVPGIGPKIASTLINEYGSLDVLLERAGEIKQKARREKLLSNTEEAVLSRKLVELDKAVPLDVMTMPDHYTTVSELKMATLSTDALFKFYDEMGFYDLTMRLRRRLGMSASEMTTDRTSEEVSNDGALVSDTVADSQTSATADEDVTSTQARTNGAPLNDSIRKGLIMHQMRKSAPPKPEEFDDVPF